MSFDKYGYINEYNKNNYKMYQFRIKKDDDLINYIDNLKNKNEFIVSTLEKELKKEVLTLKQIKSIIKPIFMKYGIFEIYLFGSYSRGEATKNSDIDILCEKGNVKTLFDQIELEEELKKSLNKNVDLVFLSANIDEYFYNTIKEDLIKLC